MAKVCVTGGAGFIGSHIVDMFLRAGDTVFVIDNLSTGFKSNLDSRARLYECDICSREAADILIKESPSVVIHAAAQMSVRVSMSDPMLDSQVNVLGMANLLHALEELTSTPRIVFLSTGGAIYGEQSEFPAPEKHQIAPTSLYGLNKYVGERYLDFWHKSFGLSYSALRLGNVYGPRQNPHGEAGVIAIFFEHLLEGNIPSIFGNGEQTRDFVYVSDVVEAVRLAVLSKHCDCFNIGTGKEVSVNKLYHEISSLIGISQDPVYAAARSGEQLRSCIDPSYAQKLLGWKPAMELQEGLRETAEWFQAK